MTGRIQSLPPGPTTLIRGARQLLTLRGPAGPRRGTVLGELGIIPDGAVLIRGGKILETGPSRRVENLALARGAEEINATGRVVLPGFVDSRTQPVAIAGLPSRRLQARLQSALNRMARHGTTTAVASVASSPATAGVLSALRVLGGLNGQPIDVISDYFINAATQEANGQLPFTDIICSEVLPVLSRRKLAELVSVNCRTLGDTAVRRILTQAHALGFRSIVHAGALPSCWTTAIEMRAAAVVPDLLENPTGEALPRPVYILLPALRHSQREYPPARALITGESAVALASGFGIESGPTYNMQMVISLASSEMGMSPAEAISAATINAAYALARGHLCGSLEPGKAADLLLLNLEDYRELAAQFGVNHVHMVLKNGNIIYREGEVSSWTRR